MVNKNRAKDSARTPVSDPREFEDRGSDEDDEIQQKISDFRAEVSGNVAAAAAGDDAHVDQRESAGASPGDGNASAGPDGPAPEPKAEAESPRETGALAQDANDEADETGGGLSAADADSPYADGWDSESAARTQDRGADIDPGTPGHPVSESDNPGTSQTAREIHFERLHDQRIDEDAVGIDSAPIAAQIDGVQQGMVPTTADGDPLVNQREVAVSAGMSGPADRMADAESYGDAGFDLSDPNAYFEDVDAAPDESMRAMDQEMAEGKQLELEQQRENAAAAARKGEAPMQDTRGRISDIQQANQEFRDDVLVQQDTTLSDVEPYLEAVAPRVEGLERVDTVAGSFRVSAGPDTVPHPTAARVTSIEGVGDQEAISLIEAGYERGSDFAGADAASLSQLDNIDQQLADRLATVGERVEQMDSYASSISERFVELSEEDARFMLDIAARNGADPREVAFQLQDTRVDDAVVPIDQLYQADNFGDTPTGGYETTVRGEVTGVVDLDAERTQTVRTGDGLTEQTTEAAESMYQVVYIEDHRDGVTKVTIPKRSLAESEPGHQEFVRSGHGSDGRRAGESTDTSGGRKDGAMPETEALQKGDVIELTNFATSQFNDRRATTDTTITVTSETDLDILERDFSAEAPSTGSGGAKPPAQTGSSPVQGRETTAQNFGDNGSELRPDYSDTSRHLRQRARKQQNSEQPFTASSSSFDSGGMFDGNPVDGEVLLTAYSSAGKSVYEPSNEIDVSSSSSIGPQTSMDDIDPRGEAETESSADDALDDVA